MTKKEKRTFVSSTVEYFLDEIQSITKDYEKTFEIFEQTAEEILFMRNDPLKYYISTIKLCLANLEIKEMRVKFTQGRFIVKIKTY
ncbi:MAG: hypothetical protein VB024_07800 [Dysgonamonadaceae bacterium]|nr:hypothetical protein [Dysgonamonadaceae bacterium]